MRPQLSLQSHSDSPIAHLSLYTPERSMTKHTGWPRTSPIASQHTRAFQLIAAILALHIHTHNTPQAKVLPRPNSY